MCDLLSELTGISMVVEEDSDAVLNCSASGSLRDQVFDWKKDQKTEVFIYAKGATYGVGMTGQDDQFRNRVVHFPEALEFGNASIKIKKAEVRDTGNYTCIIPSSPDKGSRISLLVGEFLHKTLLKTDYGFYDTSAHQTPEDV